MTRLLACFFVGSIVVHHAAAQRNLELTRTIDLSSAIVRERLAVRAAEIKGDYVISWPAELAAKLAWLHISSSDTDLPHKRLPDSDGLANFAAVGATGHVSLTVTAAFTEALTAYPAEIFQYERQLMVYNDSHYVTSIYPTEQQETTVKLGVERVESYTELKPSTVPARMMGDQLKFGPYRNITGGARSFSPLSIHYENNAPFAKASTAIREVEVSHWGNVAFEEFFEVNHAGAKLKGGFARVDYMKQEPPMSFRRLRAILPGGANAIYYRDQIGNISSSGVRYLPGAVELVIETRFPLMGGWKTQFYQGYNVPTQDLVTVAGSRRTLTVPFSVPYPDLWVEDLTVKVILPEHSSNIQVDVPFEVDETRTSRLTYLDTKLSGGRPVIILKKKNAVAEHNAKLTISYDFDQTKLFYEPLYLVGAFFAFYLLCMLAVRLNFQLASISSIKEKSG